jgi:hypothetical protein
MKGAEKWGAGGRKPARTPFFGSLLKRIGKIK